jgi:hypothetical protein
MDGIRVLIVVIAAVLVIALIAEARGPEHRRGDETGSHGTKIVVVVQPPG